MGLQDANGTLIKLVGEAAEYPREAMVLVGAGTSSASTSNVIDLYQPSAGVTNAWTSD
jgi:hypothetical protein